MSENPTKPGFQLAQILLGALVKDKKLRHPGLTNTGGENLEFICDLLENGKIKPVIEKTYSLDQIAEAHRHVENGHTKGKVVVVIG
jgi:NADPH:quinone reductase-like Zn-dependent oxidoreductase